jgi:hypothetical protein
MGWLASGADPFAYDPARGIAYHHAVFDASTLVGPQPLTPRDVEALADEHGVTHILTLQEPGDAEKWGVDVAALMAAARDAGVAHARVPARDFDPASLRGALPAAAGVIAHALSPPSPAHHRPPRVYIHCTAGLGRSPAAAIAHAMWFRGLGLDAAFGSLTATRPCAPKKCAIRGATYDLARTAATPALEALPLHAFTDLSEGERAVVRAKALAAAQRFVDGW